MNTEKLTLEHVAPYLPYGLKAFSNIYCSKDAVIGFDFTHLGKLRIKLRNDNNCDYYQSISTVKPCLRPMTLNTLIKIDGLEITPIIELAKICITHEEIEWQINEYDIICAKSKDGFNYIFDYRPSGMFYFNSIIGTPNQLQMFQWLFKHKFDVFGLIEKGLAVDVNTLETNPYEPSPITNK